MLLLQIAGVLLLDFALAGKLAPISVGLDIGWQHMVNFADAHRSFLIQNHARYLAKAFDHNEVVCDVLADALMNN